ncbi:flagellar hook-basal body complex protein FliE [bacterium]|nr:flagellar hook-basal body complex protein FliE [bacterium]
MNGFNLVNFNSNISGVNQTPMGYGRISNDDFAVEKNTNFKQVMGDMLSDINNQMNKPDDLLVQAASGTGNVDVHDVMVAMSQAEITLSVATTAVTKVIQAYDKIAQIQV